ncbi:ANTAR domain-containing protein [Streptomyces mirabilis]|uniref:ANTAR domain-containing protein n=1 Tax=Streptomyces mirabilis TaxID=68239 RepID=A0A1I2HKH1_9ACTN|nr:ANTAR domain-containing protein [Streptomyces mirabilis]
MGAIYGRGPHWHLTGRVATTDSEDDGFRRQDPDPGRNDDVRHPFGRRRTVDAPRESASPSDTADRMVAWWSPSAGCRPTGAVLREVSQRSNIKLRTVADMILARGRQGDLPPDIRAALEDTVDKYGPTQIPDSPPAP